MFLKQTQSLFVFLQGHPEYEANSLLLEYRRDVALYLNGRTDSWPQMPAHYFDSVTSDRLDTLRERALSRRDPALLADFPAGGIEPGRSYRWRPAAARFYGNWLRYLSAQKAMRSSLLFCSAPG